MTSPIVPDMPYGTNVDLSAWEANTQIVLCNVPWNNDYRDIVKWDTVDSVANYIESLPGKTTRTSTYARINAPIKIDMPFAKANKYNYVRVHNPLHGVDGDEPTNFYYFITDVQYSAPETSLIRVQLDVWTTFGFSVKFGRCFIERGHIGMANANRKDSFGRTFLTEPEGLDTGSEMVTTYVAKNLIMDTQGTQTGSNSDKPMVMVLSATQLAGSDFGDLNNPKFEMAVPGNHAGIPTGLGMYIFADVQSYLNMIDKLKTKPWVIEGIKSVTMIPNVYRYGLSTAQTGEPGITWVHILPNNRPATRKFALWANWRERATGGINSQIPARYRNLDKLKTYPYMVIEATTWNGSNLIIRPENWRDEDATFTERVSLLPPAQRVVLSPFKYNSNHADYVDPQGDDWGEHVGMSVNIDNFPTIPVMNDAATLALANNARGMAFARQQAEWSQEVANRGIANSYDQASNAIGTATAQTDLSNRSATQNTQFGNQVRRQSADTAAITGIASGSAMGMLGGPAGAVVGGAGAAIAGAISVNQANMQNAAAMAQTGMNNATASESTRIANQSSAFVRDTNRDLAAFTARGDYAMSIAGIQARVQDTQMTQPSVAGGFGGDMFRLINNMMEINLRWKIIDRAAMIRICEYWLRYGYAVNRFAVVPDSLMAMTKFTYWKLSETYIKSADMPEAYKHAIRGIFEKGVTVWDNPADIGNIDYADNQPLGGIVL